MAMHKRNIKKSMLDQNEQGLVSFVVTMILTVVLSLIVLSFAQVSRREQRNALDRQLSTQASYAAESGINAAETVLNQWVASNDPRLGNDYTTKCRGVGSFLQDSGLSPTSDPVALTGNTNASFTCLFVNPTPTTIESNPTDTQRVFQVKAATGQSLNNLAFFWDDNSSTNDFSGCPASGSNPQTWPLIPGSACHAPVMRIEVVDASIDVNTSKSFFVYPKASSTGLLSYGAASGSIGTADCSTPVSGRQHCLIKINSLPSGTDTYYVRVQPVYTTMSLTICGSQACDVKLIGQTVIDSTGKAQDVEQRVQVRLSRDLSGNGPAFGLAGTDKVCKKFTVDGTNPPVDVGNCSGGAFPN